MNTTSQPENDATRSCAPVVGSVPCPECYGGHFKPCQICGDSGWIEVVPGQIHACDCKRPIPGTKEYDEETELMQEAADFYRHHPLVSPNTKGSRAEERE